MLKYALIGLLGLCTTAMANSGDIVIKYYTYEISPTKEEIMDKLTTIGACHSTMTHMNNFDNYFMDHLAEKHYITKWFSEEHQPSVRKSYEDFKLRMIARLKGNSVKLKDVIKYEKYCNEIVRLNVGAQ